MTQAFDCAECGNPRVLMGGCQYCGSIELPNVFVDTIELNIKQGFPTVEEALDHLTEYLRMACQLGLKAIVLIHGYGSSGEGGRIKWAIHDALENNRYADRVDEYFFGEDVPFASATYYDLLKQRPGLKDYLKHFKAGNAGMTVLLLGSGRRSA
jgi:hypothetical protein